MGKITNTSVQEVNTSWLFGGSPDAIEAQEARGQNELIESTQLPIEVNGKEELESLGVVFGSQMENDPLFCEATLPNGWKKRATDHPMWSELIDENDNVVASIFYKAAFYDRRASMRFQSPMAEP